MDIKIRAVECNRIYPKLEEIKEEAFTIYDNEKKKLKQFDREMANALFSKVVCQDDTISVLLKKLNLWFIRHYKNKPLNLFFAGISGTGKTYAAEIIGELFKTYGYDYHREDMTFYQTHHDASRFIGSAEGLVGSDSPPLIVQKINDANGRMVICLDEIDKAHSSMMDTMMQMMDKGSFKSNKIEVDMRECILIFTSNLAMDELSQLKHSYKGDYEEDEFQNSLSSLLQRAGMAPWILGRFDAKFVFNPLDAKAIFDIASFEIEALLNSINPDYRLEFITPSIIENIAQSTAGSNEGARSVKRAVRSRLEGPLLVFLNSAQGCEQIQIVEEGGGIVVKPHISTAP